ncbi:sugar ABC transporter substrate-binding protein [Treponema sp. TIM-1]|uniref:ABC transporter substrate-binding protein n=1 Tax=Treponema sp. TIM-1 TaxID=2898417 RepID=UPI00397F1534
MKKLIGCLLPILVILAVVTGCKASEEKKTDLTLWWPPFGTAESMDMEFWTKSLAPWAEANKVNLSIEITPWETIEEKYLTGLSSGAGPDVGYMYAEMLDQFVTMGSLEDLAPYFSQAELDNYLYTDMGYVYGKLYTLPIIVGNVRVFFFNMDLVAKAGITTLPRTWDEFIEFGKKMQAANLGDDIYIYVPQWTDRHYGTLQEAYYPFLWTAGGDIFTQDGSRIALQDNDAAVKAAQFVYDLLYVHQIAPPESLSSLGKIEELFAQGKVVCMHGAGTVAPTFDEAGINWDFVTSLKDKREAVQLVADVLFMNSASKNKELAASLMKEMTKPSIMEVFHTEVSPFPPISRGEAYKDNPKFRSFYENPQNVVIIPVAKNNFQIQDNLFRNLQQMMMNEMSPEQAIQETVNYANLLN